MQVNIIITSLDADKKKLNTTVSWVNPNVDNNTLKSLAYALNQLTYNTYTTTTKETKEEL